MTVTKRILLQAIENAGMDDVIYVDNGVDCVECRSVEVITDDPEKHTHVSTDALGMRPLPGSIVLREA